VKKTPARGESKLETLALYRQGKKAEEIALHREMAVSTIEGHLAELVADGEVKISDFVEEALLERIKTAAGKTENKLLSFIKNELGQAATYGQIRMALNHLKRVEET